MVRTSGEVLWLAPRFHQNVICLILSLHYNNYHDNFLFSFQRERVKRRKPLKEAQQRQLLM